MNGVEFTEKHTPIFVYYEEERAYVCENYRFSMKLFLQLHMVV